MDVVLALGFELAAVFAREFHKFVSRCSQQRGGVGC